jgi:hypothetical protein
MTSQICHSGGNYLATCKKMAKRLLKPIQPAGYGDHINNGGNWSLVIGPC